MTARAPDFAFEDAARQWAAAFVANQNADPAMWTAALADLLTAQHDLLILAGQPCSNCEKDSCPGPVNQPLRFTPSAQDVLVENEVL